VASKQQASQDSFVQLEQHLQIRYGEMRKKDFRGSPREGGAPRRGPGVSIWITLATVPALVVYKIAVVGR